MWRLHVGMAFSIVVASARVVAAQPRPDPPPPASVDGAQGHRYEAHEKTFGGDGHFLAQLWYHWYLASDAKYVVGQARVVVTPPSGGATEDIEFKLGRPNDECYRLIKWIPIADAGGATISGGINIDEDPGINIAPDVTLGAEGVEIEDAGPDENENAFWFVDVTDESDTADRRISLDFMALWRCPVARGALPPSHYPWDPELGVEIDSWGPDERYWWFGGDDVYDGSSDDEDEEETALGPEGTPVIELASGLSEHPRPRPDTPVVALADIGDRVAVVPGDRVRVRARVYAVGELPPVNATATLGGGESVPMAAVKKGTAPGGRRFVELAATVEVPPTQDASLTPVVAFSGADLAAVSAQPLLVAAPMPAGKHSVAPGRHAFRLRGEPGAAFRVLVVGGADAARAVVYRDSDTDGRSARRLSPGAPMVAAFRERGPLLVLDVSNEVTVDVASLGAIADKEPDPGHATSASSDTQRPLLWIVIAGLAGLAIGALATRLLVRR